MQDHLEGYLNEEDLDNFRREVKPGLSSYPHPHQNIGNSNSFNGLGPIMGIYQAIL